MIDTNQLLQIAVTLISNFANTATIPNEHVPHHVDDFQRIVVGSRYSPLDLWLTHKSGAEFWISHGVVWQYESPDSYFHLQSMDNLPRLVGVPTLNSNQAVSAASAILRAARRTENPGASPKPVVKTTNRRDIPFFLINWPNTNLNNFGLGSATVEIDGRTGRPAFVQLWADEYYDYPFASVISNEVYKPDPPHGQATKDIAKTARPPVEEVRALIPIWLSFCERLGLDHGSQTNISDVDWNSTFRGAAPPPFPAGTLFGVHFRNGTIFEAVDRTVFGHVCGDASFVGAWAERPPEYWKTFVASPNHKWNDLAEDLNNRLVEKLGVSRTYLKKYIPTPYALGTGGVAHCVVRWCESASVGKVSPDSIRTGLWVEFDLSNGEIKNLTFQDWNMLKMSESDHPGRK